MKRCLRTSRCLAVALVAVAALVAPAGALAGALAASAPSPRVNPEALYARWAPGVVSITVVSEVISYFGTRQVEGEGSGFVIDAKGDIVTNQHVTDGAISITVRFSDGKTTTATLVAEDASTDIAVIRVPLAAHRLVPLVFGNSALVRPGRSVVAIGSPFGLSGTITEGIVSAIGRTITSPDQTQLTDAIQTDAAINAGNSGGPLIDASGRVIGMNAQINSKSGGSEGVGFAIPANTVKRIVAAMVAAVPAPTPGRSAQ